MALALATAGYAQTDTPQTQPQQTQQTQPPQTEPKTQAEPGTSTTDPSSASSPHQREATSTEATEQPAGGSSEAESASSPHQREATSTETTEQPAGQAGQQSGSGEQRTSTLLGTKVQSPSGERLGQVDKVITDERGNAAYLVVAYGGGGAQGKRVAIPWSAASAMMKGDTLQLGRSQLEQAPELPATAADVSKGTWSREADNYWRSQVALKDGSGSTAPSTPQGSQAPQGSQGDSSGSSEIPDEPQYR